MAKDIAVIFFLTTAERLISDFVQDQIIIPEDNYFSFRQYRQKNFVSPGEINQAGFTLMIRRLCHDLDGTSR